MEAKIYPWHQENFQRLVRMRETMPHAMVFHGPEGTGIESFAVAWAKTLLCENPQAGQPACGQCSSCRWFDQGSHPDFVLLMPDALNDDEEDAPAAEEEDAPAKKAKAASKIIPINAIRQLHDFVGITTHRGGLRVILIHPVEAMTTEAANALLKMLEEPPAGTVFLLVTNQVGALLPTILSRCGKLAFPMPGREVALEWLASQEVDDAAMLLAQQGGAPLAALEASKGNANAKEQAAFLDCLSKPGLSVLLKAAEDLQKLPVKLPITWMQRWLYDLASVHLAGTVRYHPDRLEILTSLAGRLNLIKLMDLAKSVAERRRVADHPLVPRLVLEDMLIDYLKLFAKRP